MVLPGTVVYTGYKIVAGVMIVYGFIITGTKYTQTPTPNNTTDSTPTDIPTTAAANDSNLDITTPSMHTADTTQRTTDSQPTTVQTSDEHTTAAQVTKQENKWAKCGVPPTARERFFSGTPTDEGDWPWAAYIYEKRAGRLDGFICGGTLIADQWVLSAAHCFSRPNSPHGYGVVLGEHSASTPSVNERDMNVSAIVRHEKYAGVNLNNDIALIKLAEPVTFTRYIRPVCLPPNGFPTDSNTKVLFNGKETSFAGRVCTVIGWGQSENKPKEDILQQVNLNIIPHFLCEHLTKSSLKSYGHLSVESDHARFCAGGAAGEDTCSGDSGGPLLCIGDEDGNYYVHGITSYGTNPCGQKTLPGVYTRVADYHDWITKITA